MNFGDGTLDSSPTFARSRSCSPALAHPRFSHRRLRQRQRGLLLDLLFDRHPPGVGANGERIDTPFYTVNYDFRLRLAGTAAAVKA
jgi:hypothetical protein